MHRDGVAYISVVLLFTSATSAFAAESHSDNPETITAFGAVNPSFILMNGLTSTGGTQTEASEISAAPFSEQLRIYDQPTPVVRVSVPQRVAASPRTKGRSKGRAEALRPLIDDVGRRYAIDPDLLRSIANVESGHNPRAVSPKGAQGLMQVMPATGRRFGAHAASLADPAINLDVAANYLKTLQGLYGNNLPLVLAAYNAGEGAVKKYGGTVPPYRETQGYVRKVMGLYGEAVAGR